MQVTTFPLGPLETNCYLAEANGEALAVDPGGEPSELLAYLESSGCQLTRILITHMHFDHLYGAAALARATGAPILCPAGDEFLMQSEIGRGGLMGFPLVEDFDYEHIAEGIYEFMGCECRVLATPGHTPGSLSYYFPAGKCVFVGDLLFYRSIGRTDFPGGDMEQLLDSVRTKIFTLPPETVVYAGHMLSTTVGDEMLHNPFLSEGGL
ncbi:MBL fold metallo-hydrolase [Desulfovibrio sp. X2]|uniref:MBL fold metallo-hydrolase n=1 Tax=Desulfovibrio sp. X2 TaxID=941449 RepID=UPI000550FFE5|nr:MBL fold metallo-hydrolase [Desulfovibrio sp. X2]